MLENESIKFGKIIMEMLVNGIIDGTRFTVNVFANNYEKRRDVGYDRFGSFSGSIVETNRYLYDIIRGIDPPYETIRGIYFVR